MKPTFFAVVVLAAVSASAAPPPANPANTPTSAPAAGTAPTKSSDLYAAADRRLGELNRGVDQLSGCVAAYEYLQASAAKAATKYTGADGTVPSHMAALIPTKRKMADDKRVACIAQGNALGIHFSTVRTEFAEYEPRNAKGLPARRLELTEMRGQMNALMKKLGGKPGKPSNARKPTKASESDEGAADAEESQ